VDTPGYKRQDIDFESTLREELGRCKHESLDAKMSNVDLDNLNASVYTDLSNYSYRLDDNNVDIDVEEVEYASEQIRYEAITTGINNEFSRMKAVIS
jgi:flagellar basal-body rod protein FlgB